MILTFLLCGKLTCFYSTRWSFSQHVPLTKVRMFVLNLCHSNILCTYGRSSGILFLHFMKSSKYWWTSVFCPRVRARALRAPVFLAHCHAKRGAARPLLPVAASLLLILPPKIYKIYRIWVAGVKAFFFQLYHRGQRVYRVPGLLSSRPNWVPPPPHPQESVVPPPFGS
jgi:hypothetical protein